MSIFAGDFKDGAGVPFDPHSYAHAGAGDSQVMQRRYFGQRHGSWKLPHHVTLGKLADVWLRWLTAEQRDLWVPVGSAAAWMRDYQADMRDRAFVTFAMANFAVTCLEDGEFQVEPNFEGVTCVWASVGEINTEQQTLEALSSYDEFPLPDHPGQTWLYQIDPKRVASRRRERFTRLVTVHNDWDVDDPIQSFDGAAAWPFVSGDEIYLLVRHEVGCIFQQNFVVHAPAP